jgi:ketosteroid isomerase-like protein
MSTDAVTRLVRFFESFGPSDLGRLGEYYTEDAYFKDPFNEVRGLAEVKRVYAHMFEALDAPRFVVTSRVGGDAECFLVWDFHFRFKGQAAPQVVRGTSHLKFAADGRVHWHRDYWDAAEELYEKIPLLGGFMRWLKRRAGGS